MWYRLTLNSKSEMICHADPEVIDNLVTNKLKKAESFVHLDKVAHVTFNRSPDTGEVMQGIAPIDGPKTKGELYLRAAVIDMVSKLPENNPVVSRLRQHYTGLTLTSTLPATSNPQFLAQ